MQNTTYSCQRNTTEFVDAEDRRLALKAKAAGAYVSPDMGACVFLLSIDDVSATTVLSASTLAKRRCDGSGPAYFKIGRAVKYDAADVEAWLLSRRRLSTWTVANDNIAATKH